MKKIIVAIGLSLVSFGSLFSQTKIYNLPTNIGTTWDWLPTTQGLNTVKIAPSSLWLGIPFAIKDEGTNLVGSGATSINFTGAGVTATQVSNAITVNIPAASGGGSSIETAPAISNTGTVTLTFDAIRYFQKTTQTGNITLSLAASGHLNGRTQVLDIDGNSANTLSFPSTWSNSNGTTFNNSLNNIIYLDYVNGKVKYNITQQTIPAAPDITAPTYNIQTVAGISSIGATFSTQINEAGFVKLMLTTSATAPTKPAILAGTGAVGSSFGSMTMASNITNTFALSGLTAATTYYLWSYAEDGVPNQTAIQTAISFITASGVQTETTTYSNAVTAAGGTLSVAQINAYDAAISSLKGSATNLYSKIAFMYPRSGGNAASNAINLKTPGTKNITWAGGVTHTALGTTGNGTTGYGNTGIIPSTDLGTLNSGAFYVYARTLVLPVAVGSKTLLGSTSNVSTYNPAYRFTTYYNGSGHVIYPQLNNAPDFGTATLTSGRYLTNRASSSTLTVYKNGTSISVIASTSTSMPTAAIYEHAENANGAAAAYFDGEIGLSAYFNIGLTAQEITDFDAIMTTLFTALGK